MLPPYFGLVADAHQSRTLVKFSHSHTFPGMCYSLCNILAGSNLPRVADRFGRKTSFYLAWLWLVIVSRSLCREGYGPESQRQADVLGLCFA